MQYEKLYSVIYALHQICKSYEIKEPTYIFQNESGIFKGSPLLIEQDQVVYKTIYNDIYDPIQSFAVSSTNSNAFKFNQHIRSTNVWQHIQKLTSDPEFLFKYLSDSFDNFSCNQTNQKFDRKMYNIHFLDKKVDLPFINVSESIELLSIINTDE